MESTFILPTNYSGYTPGIMYKLDGAELFSVYGIVVSSSKGIIDAPAIKAGMKVNWEDAHGEAIDNNHVYYEAKDISLDCWMLAESKLDLTEKLQTFYIALASKGLHRLFIEIDEDKPLIYQVYLNGKIVADKQWYKGSCYAKFTLNLREPEPVKAIYMFQSAPSTANIMITTAKPVNVYWDDNALAISKDVIGDSLTLTHQYQFSGKKWIIITGDIDAISYFSINATEVWSKLL